MEQKKYDPALKDFMEALRINPRFLMALNNRGNLYIQQGKYELALKDFNEILRYDPSNTEAWDSRGNVFYSRGLNDSAIANFNYVLKLNPKNTNALINRGNTLLAMGKRGEAVTDYRTAITIEPKKLGGWFNLANGFIQIYQYDSAIRYSNDALRYNNKYPPALNTRALAFYYLGNINAAEEDITLSLQVNPRSPTALNILGMICTQKEMLDSALNAYNWALLLEPKNIDVLNNRGLLLYNTNRFKEAILDYQKALDIQPANGRLMINLVLVYIASDQFDKASALYKQYKEKKISSYMDEFGNFGFLKNYIIAATDFLSIKDYKNAIPLLQSSLEEYKLVNPGQGSNSLLSLEYGNVLLRTGWALEQAGESEKALVYFRKAAIIKPQLTELSDKVARLNQEIKEKKLSENAFPVIQLLTPELIKDSTVSGSLSSKGTLFVSGIVKDISGIKWVKVNGKDATTLNDDGYFAFNVAEHTGGLTIQTQNKAGKISRVRYQYTPMGPGENSTSENIPPIPPTVKPTYHAVLIACSDYSGDKWAKLPSTIGEAKEYKKVLTSQYGFKESNILEIYDKGSADILAGLSSKLQSLNDNDNLVILFAGHGTYRKIGNELIGYWVPLNASRPEIDYISNRKLDELVFDCKARHILLISDACYSAAMRGAKEEKEDIPQLPKNVEYKYKSRQILTSGGLAKVPEESVFIKMMLKSLEENEEKFISAKMLYNLIFSGVRNQTNLEPELNLFGREGNEGGQFYFIRSK